MPASAKVRERSSSSRVRSQASTCSSTRNDVSFSPPSDTLVKRSGSFISGLDVLAVSRWIVMPRPSEM